MLKKCPICNEYFKTYPSTVQSGRKFCSWECFQKSLNQKEKHICIVCGNEFEAHHCRSTRGDRLDFCSRKCYHKYRLRLNTIIEKEDYAEMHILNRKKEEFVFLIDKEDIDKILDYRWYAKTSKGVPYAQCSNGLRLHRYIMNCPEDMVIDHINHNTLDNRKQNLRICTIKENTQNLSMPISNKSGYMNIHKRGNKWSLKITRDFKTFRKSFKEIEDAIKFRDYFLNIFNIYGFEKLNSEWKKARGITNFDNFKQDIEKIMEE